jgi:hypothetical protein
VGPGEQKEPNLAGLAAVWGAGGLSNYVTYCSDNAYEDYMDPTQCVPVLMVQWLDRYATLRLKLTTVLRMYIHTYLPYA